MPTRRDELRCWPHAGGPLQPGEAPDMCHSLSVISAAPIPTANVAPLHPDTAPRSAHWVHTLNAHSPRSRASPGPGCGNWGSRSSASMPPPHVTRGSRTWRWWASSRSQPPVPVGRLPTEQHRALTRLPGLPSWGRGPGRQARPLTYLLHAHLLRHHDDAAVALHRGCQGQPDP